MWTTICGTQNRPLFAGHLSKAKKSGTTPTTGPPGPRRAGGRELGVEGSQRVWFRFHARVFVEQAQLALKKKKERQQDWGHRWTIYESQNTGVHHERAGGAGLLSRAAGVRLPAGVKGQEQREAQERLAVSHIWAGGGHTGLIPINGLEIDR